MADLKADIIARVTLYPTTSGGRETPIPAVRFGCPLFIAGEGFDCRLLLDQTGVALSPGASAEVPIKFLFLNLVKNRLAAGFGSNCGRPESLQRVRFSRCWPDDEGGADVHWR
jgi:hypothetical protein